jgi:G3E family GTPase
MGGRIPVTVVTGFLGSGKTTLLNRLLRTPATKRMAVIVNEIGEAGLDHQFFKRINDNVVLLESGCVCCSVRGELVSALRDLFMAALHKKIPALDRVLIETTGMADPAPVMYTLQYERFLGERYVYDGCIAVIDSVFGREQLDRHPEALQQAALADVIVLSKTDLAEAGKVAALNGILQAINADAPQYEMGSLPGFTEIIAASALKKKPRAMAPRPTATRSLWSRPGPDTAMAVSHAGVQVLTLSLPDAITRPVFLRAMHSLQANAGAELLRIKGRVRFHGENQASIVHGMHRQLYPIEPWPGDAPDAGASPSETDSVLVFVLRGGDAAAFDQKARGLLGMNPKPAAI